LRSAAGTPRGSQDPGITLRPGRELEDAEACVALQRDVWGLSDLEVTPAIQLVATCRAGGSLILAEVDGRVVGFAYAFPGLDRGEGYLHSDMLAVLPGFRGRGVGLALKRAQREAARAAGIRRISWTFDPLQARNARLNLRRLGAVGEEFLPNLYGVTSSALHHGLPTHRLLVNWRLEAAPPDRGSAPGNDELPDLLRLGADPERALGRGARRLLVELPRDFGSLARVDPGAAASWHARVCRALELALRQGYRAVDLILPREPPESAFYVLERGLRS
jgi:predicted GNAT superfamily acetyltransferase